MIQTTEGSSREPGATWRAALDSGVDGDQATRGRPSRAEECVVGVPAPAERLAGQPVRVAQ